MENRRLIAPIFRIISMISKVIFTHKWVSVDACMCMMRFLTGFVFLWKKTHTVQKHNMHIVNPGGKLCNILRLFRYFVCTLFLTIYILNMFCLLHMFCFDTEVNSKCHKRQFWVAIRRWGYQSSQRLGFQCTISKVSIYLWGKWDLQLGFCN